MEFCIFVLILFFDLNHCDPTKVQHNQVASVNFNQETLFVSTKNNSKEGRVVVLETPLKSKYDKKSYRLIRLSNGLTALLVSTQHVSFPQKTSVCSLRIDVGSFSNPRDAQGLAHLVEHMVFMGSNKYPGENEFNQFIRKSGGFCHAQTDFDDTSFQFETLEEYFDKALDRFSQLFEAPLMRKVSLLREREAVESEFSLVKTNDDARNIQLLTSLGEMTHPASIFQWGNSKSLKENIDDDELYRKAVEFRKRYYSAHHMHLCLQSNQTLDDLQEVVVRHFSTIPNNNIPDDDFSAFTHLNAFQSKFYEKVFFLKSIRIGLNIEITWCLKPMMKKFKSKHTFMLNHLLKRDGKGSLMSYLRKNLWATKVNANLYKSGFGYNALFSLFNIDIRLTKNGFDHIDDVLAAVFSYIKFLQRVDLNASIFYELQTTRANVKRFSHDIEPWFNVGNLTSNMIRYPSKDIVLASDNFFDYDAKAVKKTIDKINSRKFNVMITLKRSRTKQVSYNSIESWFGIKYMEMDMPVKWMELQRKAKPFPEFTLPEINPFIADNFTILKTNGSSVLYNLLDNGFCEVWYRQSNKITRPHAQFYITLMKPHAETSIDTEIYMTLLAMWLKYQMVEKLYAATLAGIQYTCEQANSQLRFHINGFNQKMHLAIDIFSKTLKSLANGPTEEQFNVFVQQQFEIYEKEILNPESLSMELHSSTVQSLYHPIWNKYKRLRSISFFDFQQFCRSFCVLAKIEAFVHGNIDKDHTIDIMQNILNDFHCERIRIQASKESEPKKLPIGVHYLRVKNFNLNDANSKLQNFYQIGPKSCHTQALLDLLEMIAQTLTFEFLRVKEQLSYDVSFNSHNDLGIVGYSISVNSQETKFRAHYVDERIENFRRELLTFIEHMSLDDFDTYKKSLAKTKWIAYDKSIESIEWSWWNDDDQFDQVSKDVEYLSTITKEQLLEFYSTHLDAKNQRKLSIQVIGNSQAVEIDSDSDDIAESFDKLIYVNFTGEPKGILITDLMEFRKNLENYKLNENEDCYEEFLSNSVNAKAIIHLDIRTVFYCFLPYIYFNIVY